MSEQDYRRPLIPSDVVQAPAAASFTPPATAGRVIGEIIWHIGNTGLEGIDPGPWLGCHGLQYPIADYPALAAVLGTMWEAAFGAADPDNFRTPNLGGRFALAAGAPEGYSAGTIGGEATHLLTEAELAAHAHSGQETTGAGGTTGPTNAVPPHNSTPAPGAAGFWHTDNAGGGQPHNNMPPYVVISAYVYTGLR